MTYKTTVDYINSMLRFGIKPGLDRISNLLNLIGNPQRKLKFIHVAGTNGKGSTCAYIASIFKSAGYKTGLFVSPYVVDFRERFQINGEMIEKAELVSLVRELKPIIESLEDDKLPTEFEFITAVAMLYFARKECDIVVLEVGLGGRFDSTNVIDTPVCSVITSISLDHVAILGDTVAKIAIEKAGIIKPNGVTVCYPKLEPDAFDVIDKAVRDRDNKLIVPDISKLWAVDSSISGDTIQYGNLKFKLPILGDFQPLNAIVATEAALSAKEFNITEKNIIEGIENTVFAARCEVLDTSPVVILDGAHNPDGARALCKVIKEKLNKKPVAIIGMMADKDIEGVLCELAPLMGKVITVTVDNPRSISAKELAVIARKHCDDVTVAESVDTALDIAFSNDDDVVICGSFYLAGDIREKAIQKVKIRQNKT